MPQPTYQNLLALAEVRLFDVLGVTGTPEEEERTAAELAAGVWDEFAASDLFEELPEEALAKMESFLNANAPENPDDTPAVDPNELIEVIRPFMPDIGERLANRMLELKANMFMERVGGLESRFQNDPAKLAQVRDAADLGTQGQWAQAVQQLNAATA